MLRSRHGVLFPLLLIMTLFVPVEAAERAEVSFPDVPGYKTLACDFHMHTVFSDGSVWPTVRVNEAWRNGLDALSITDHIEYLPHKDDVTPNFNRPYETAAPAAANLNLLLIRGAEITRDEPHGHFNAIFLSDCAALDVPDQKDAVRIANEQGAFVFWNHPEWKRQGYDVWGPIQEEYLKNGWVHGIEVFNGEAYYENAHKWSIEKGLTVMANTDVHGPIDEAYNYAQGQHRAMTLVFAEEKTPEAILEALKARRTVAFSDNKLVGEEQWVKPLVSSSITITPGKVALRAKGEALVNVHNSCAATFNLEKSGDVDGMSFSRRLTLPAGQTVALRMQSDGSMTSGEKAIALPFAVTNVLTAPGEHLKLGLPVTVKSGE